MPARRKLPAEAKRDAELVRRLGAWFDAEKRDLPWRRTRDPYAIWLSEVMLQQTRVVTVVEYWSKFLARWPTARALAAASGDDVLGAWSGLGYYRRARALHAGARELVARYGGELPKTAALLETIPGIGRYTAGAIASIAFGVRAAVVDGNVARVYARIFGVGDDVRAPAGVRAIWAIADRVVPAERPGRHNEALMELGATVCLPREPRCDACPVRELCVARRDGRQADLPVATKKAAPKVVHFAALVAKRRGELLVGRRRDGGLFGGLWEPPMVERAAGEGPGEALLRLFPETTLTLAGSARHVLTHREMRVTVMTGTPRALPKLARASGYDRLEWVAESDLDLRGVSTLTRKLLAGVGP